MRRFLQIAVLAATVAPQAHAQILRVDCGSSTLFLGTGCGSTLFLPSSTVYAGVVYGGGRVSVGASDTFDWHHNTISVGSRQLGFAFDGTGLGFTFSGVSIERKTGPDNSVAAFLGASSLALFTPFVQAVRFQQEHAAGGLFIRRRWRGAKLYSLEMTQGRRYTAAEGIDYQLHRRLRIYGSGGALNSSPYANGTVLYQPILNHATLYASHQSVFQPFKATGDAAGVSLSLGRWTAQAAANESSSLGKRLDGETVGGGVRIAFVRMNGAWYKSGSTVLTSENFSETFFWHHLTLTQNISQSNGQQSYAFGGGIHTNRLAASLNRSIVFLLNGEGFQQVTGVQISVRLPRDVTANFSTVTTPLGQTLYSIYGETYQQIGAWTPGTTVHAPPLGRFEFIGRVVDQEGRPVDGAAVMVGRVIAYSNSAGEFSVRTKKAKAEPLSVLPAIFAAPGDWEVVSAPKEVTAHDTTTLRVPAMRLKTGFPFNTTRASTKSAMPVLIVVRKKS